MSKASKTYFADTTIVYYKLHGHSLLKEAVREAVKSGTLTVSNFVRGEYIRGYITGLIDLYSVIKEEDSVEDGMHLFGAEVGSRPRKLNNAFQSVAGWLCGFEDWQNVAKTLRRLAEHIRLKLTEFDMKFPKRARDPLECEIGIMSFASESFDERLIYDFLNEYERIRTAPGCNQCGFRKSQAEKLAAAQVDLYGPKPREEHKGSKGYIKQAEWIEKAVNSDLTQPSCWYCDRLGDTIVALSAPTDATILSGDAQAFPALASILGKSLNLVPSLFQLRPSGEH
jgi:hypothetical protein